MIILGIDPGIAIVGYGVIEVDRGNFKMIDYGTITTPKEESKPARLCMIERALIKLIEQYKPDEISIEELFFSTNTKTAMIVAEARGVLLLTASKYCGSLFEYTPNQIKQAVTGSGRADKLQVQQMVKTILRLKNIPKPDDAADALAVAITHGQTNRMSGQFRIK